MSRNVSAFDLDDYQALIRMTQSDAPFAATIAKATLAIVEARRDAEVRAASAEAALEAEGARLERIRDVLKAAAVGAIERDDAFDHISDLVGISPPGT